jgi:hypothetical protein
MEGLIDTDVPPNVGQHVIAVLREALASARQGRYQEGFTRPASLA